MKNPTLNEKKSHVGYLCYINKLIQIWISTKLTEVFDRISAMGIIRC